MNTSRAATRPVAAREAVTIRRALDASSWRGARVLIREYAASLAFSLDFQGFAHELETLRTEYGPPSGALHLARAGPRYAGCVALRRLDEETCEMKRLFVRPAYRHLGLGRRLATGILGEARRLGYRWMVLDTVPSMTAAIALYRSLGFEEIPPYRFNPIPGAVYLRCTLGGAPGRMDSETPRAKGGRKV